MKNSTCTAHNCILVEGEGKELLKTSLVVAFTHLLLVCGWGWLGRALYLVADLSMVVTD